MGRAVVWVMLSLFAGTGLGSAQSFLADQFQFVEPGLSVEVFRDNGAVGCDFNVEPGAKSFTCWSSGNSPIVGGATDSVGNFYQITKRVVPPSGTMCLSENIVFDIERLAGSGTQLVARVPYCSLLTPEPNPDFQYSWLVNLAVDSLAGYLYLGVFSRVSPQGKPDRSASGIVRISGLTPFLDILNSYEPPSTLAFRVPPRPEGLPSGDSFDVYTGDVSTLPDLSQAVPLACDAAAGMVPGDHVSVADALPSPGSGEARYYLTAVTSGMQRRAGRQASEGVLKGRDAIGLVACSP